MRIDKYLWCIRYFKTRTMATTACKKGHVRVNEDIVKPSREVYPQDQITLRKDQINYQIIVNDIPESRIGAKLVDIYRKDITPKDQFEAQALLKLSKDYYRKKGVGRPTKKDRRDLDDFTDESSVADI
ncbi:RNA-binding S4 domain-containing protein [Yeosuana sp.]|uniref:RNA-binding S4 domain-containing protein n=1 Tax=Yeosuana sp. TaxID=2529388 RepID=UPI0040552E25